MKTVGTLEAKTHLSRLIAEVERTGEEIIIQRRGRNVAVLGPCRSTVESHQERMDRIIEGFRRIRASQEVPTTHEEIREWVNEGRKY
jgi:prevent-host-death family protein